MQKKRLTVLMAIGIVLVAFLVLSCAGQDVIPATPQPEPPAVSKPIPPSPAENPPEPVESELPAGWETFVNEDIYFNKKSAVLLPAAKEILDRKAAWLKAHPNLYIVIQGHSDETGTAEYNFALADHRAGNVKSYLLQYGIESSRLAVVSYGKESPADLTTDEPAGSRNRRVHFTIDVRQ